MSSFRRIRANRQNGTRPNGPVTPQGKAASSQNAATHGLSARTLVLSKESNERFQELLESLGGEFQPDTDAEAQCVLQMAAGTWRLQRAWTIETALIDHRVDAGPVNPIHTDQAVRTALAFQKLYETGRTVARAKRISQNEPNPISGHLSETEQQ